MFARYDKDVAEEDPTILHSALNCMRRGMRLRTAASGRQQTKYKHFAPWCQAGLVRSRVPASSRGGLQRTARGGGRPEGQGDQAGVGEAAVAQGEVDRFREEVGYGILEIHLELRAGMLGAEFDPVLHKPVAVEIRRCGDAQLAAHVVALRAQGEAAGTWRGEVLAGVRLRVRRSLLAPNQSSPSSALTRVSRYGGSFSIR